MLKLGGGRLGQAPLPEGGGSSRRAPLPRHPCSAVPRGVVADLGDHRPRQAQGLALALVRAELTVQDILLYVPPAVPSCARLCHWRKLGNLCQC